MSYGCKGCSECKGAFHLEDYHEGELRQGQTAIDPKEFLFAKSRDYEGMGYGVVFTFCRETYWNKEHCVFDQGYEGLCKFLRNLPLCVDGLDETNFAIKKISWKKLQKILLAVGFRQTDEFTEFCDE